MKTPLLLAFIAAVSALPASSQDSDAQASRNGKRELVGYEEGTRGANHKQWLKVERIESPDGRVEVVTNLAYVELATGLHFRDEQGQWRETREEFKVVPGWAVAHAGPHKVSLAYNLNTAGPVAVHMPDGQVMRSQVLSLYYFDKASDKSVRLAEIKDCAGKVLPPNQVIYEDAFEGIRADVRFTYTKAGIEQDVILRQQPPAPASLGLNPSTTVLAVLTEFINPPPLAITRRAIGRTGGATEASDADDAGISFGAMRIGRGRAFSQETNSTIRAQKNEAQVIKRWMELQGRYFLLEKVRLTDIEQELVKLPQQAAIGQKSQPTMLADFDIPAAREIVGEEKHMELTQNFQESPGYVLDYVQLNADATNFTFQGDMTYYVSGTVLLSGTTTIEGGTVIKFNPDASTYLTLSGGVNCKTGPYRVAAFTSKHDNSIGETISGSSGNPSPIINDVYYLTLDSMTNVALQNLRMSYGYDAFTTLNCSNVVCTDFQIKHTWYPVYPLYTDGLRFRNALISDTPDSVFWIYDADVAVEHLTVNRCGTLGYKASSSGASLAITNSLLVAVTNMGGVPLTTNTCAVESSGSGVFQTVGGGSHYLANDSSYRNAGTTNINATLLASLKTKTTYPPLVYSNLSLSTPQTLGPVALRDTDTPDLGYHYDPLDQVFGGCVLTTNLTFTNGTAVAWFSGYGSEDGSGQPYGMAMNNGANVSMQGVANAPVWFMRFHVAQEGNSNWSARGWMPGLMLNGDGNSPKPQINAGFTKWSAAGGADGFFRDNWNYGDVRASHSEFLSGGLATYGADTYFTNCLFDRMGVFFFGDADATDITLRNCTFNEGVMMMKRFDWGPTSYWDVENCAFDGMNITTYDEFYANSNYTHMDYNAFNPSNTNWMTHPYNWDGGVPKTNVLEVAGPHDVTVTNYNFQSGTLGNYYLPTNSPLINVGSTNAGLVGLYHYTTTTNQLKETTTTVDIGYHYLALGASGQPVDTDGDGIPDYLEDANGNGNGQDDAQSWVLNPYNGLSPSTGVRVFTPLK